MVTISGSAHKFCDGVTRRSFLKIGAFGAGLGLPDILRARAAAGADATSTPKAAIMVYLAGGPSHLDTYDLKPAAPIEYRGEFQPIATNVPGVHICEHLPLQARMFDKLALIRSVPGEEDHFDSLVNTGYSQRENRTAHHPSFGAVVSRLRGQRNAVPPFVSLRGLSIGLEPGYLGVAHRAFTLTGQGMENLRLPEDVDQARNHERRSLLESFDEIRRDIDASGTLRGMDTFTARAFDMVASGAVRRALDLKREDRRVRDCYRGVEQFLTARRLIEAGVGCVTLAIGEWDTHRGNFADLRRQLPHLDRGVSSLISDLHARGLDRDVVTVVWGEFGRTPRINAQAGRDHWPPVMSVLVSGGGLRMGQVIGSSSARGEYPRDRRYSVSQVLRTLYRAIGIDPSLTFPDNSGRPRHILEDREPVQELL
jgi:hypothetical protein